MGKQVLECNECNVLVPYYGKEVGLNHAKLPYTIGNSCKGVWEVQEIETDNVDRAIQQHNMMILESALLVLEG